ncbi:MAG: metalloregulator ArsR/SmtB family transcription factor [Rhizobium sp.]|nr:metalloregulator ArsR/SmtB family transcription factor [Rhizobium sp.]MCZ8351527.1 metalloregulator ArsR/SmtB family transcription factor [Rhizobium sp.]
MAKRGKTDLHPAMDKISSRVFHALASDPRRMMLVHLSQSTLTAGEIAARFDMAKPSISQHLSILENAELIEGEKKGQYIHYSLRPAALRHALTAMLTTTDVDGETAGALAAEETVAKAKKPSKKKADPAEVEASSEKEEKTSKAKASEKPAKEKPVKEKPKKAEAELAPAPQQMGLLDLLGMN